MLIDPIYYAIFYDIEFPLNLYYAMNKRITKKQFDNLSDNLPFKTVSLDNVNYQILNTKTFNIVNTVDNHIFLICEIKKL